MVTKRTVYTTLIAVFTSSCALFWEDNFDKKALTYKNKFVFDNQFKMDGMYLMYHERDKYWNLIYFFQNGSYYSAAIDEPSSNYNFFGCRAIPQGAYDLPYYWGCFIVEDNILKVQTYTQVRYHPFTKLKVREKWAEIVNDTTIHFFKAIDPGGKERSLDETFHFRYCTNKPDSTNILMRD